MTSFSRKQSLSIVILAAGAGSRMKSALPKPLHTVAGRPMLAQVLEIARSLEPDDVTITGSPDLIAHLQDVPWTGSVMIATQYAPRGTGDAVRIALEQGVAGDVVLVLYADHPLVTTDVLHALIERFDSECHKVAVMTCTVDDAAGYGRIVWDDDGNVRSIIEKVDDDDAQRSGAIEINSGVMALDREWALGALQRLEPNPRKNEYFLTDLVALAARGDPASVTASPGTQDVLIGVNDRVELAVADFYLRERKRVDLQRSGVTLIAPASNQIDLDVEIESDTTVGPNCILEHGTRIGSHCRIGPNSVIRASKIGNRAHIESSTVEFSLIGDDSDVGPYAHVRDRSDIGAHVHIGNFAEIKSSRIGTGVRMGHFSYVGDADLGSEVNIGAGAVTCNFDGVTKHRTEIGNNAFIGSDTMLIAPVSVGDGARTGAGSVVTRDVPDGATVVGMPARRIQSKAVDQHDSKRGASK